MILWRNIENNPFYYFDSDYVYYMLGGNLGSLLYGDVSVMRQATITVPYTLPCIYLDAAVISKCFTTELSRPMGSKFHLTFLQN